MKSRCGRAPDMRNSAGAVPPASRPRSATQLAWHKVFDGDISIYSYYRKYAWDSLPVIIPHYMQKDLQWYAKVPVQGVSTYAEPEAEQQRWRLRGGWSSYPSTHIASVVAVATGRGGWAGFPKGRE